ncbi:hypothetical protein JF535_05875 [Microbulbifer salipaludis]|uniref:Uncharacterized protein n=1 Tax=Microbulbifer salipaludis TaxID=187980 RepID=A0ABS3E503_9GAMM|nr:hypothetical protein [Microbulbifer salipaludis]MBN8430380.1 hypothetical protein [Microbulbifer salipaludis]
MSTFTFLLGCCAAVMFFSLFLYVVFGQVTVRKLRKNPETRSDLGLEFASGWDILNVAQALATPSKIHKVLESGQLSFLHANSDLIKKHTNFFDKIIAIIFFWSFMGSAMSMLALIGLDKLNFFS